MFDDYFSNPFINLHREKIHHKTVLNVLRKYEISEDVDLLSEDTDYADYWIIEKILTKYQPKVLIHEVNQELPDSFTFFVSIIERYDFSSKLLL